MDTIVVGQIGTLKIRRNSCWYQRKRESGGYLFNDVFVDTLQSRMRERDRQSDRPTGARRE